MCTVCWSTEAARRGASPPRRWRQSRLLALLALLAASAASAASAAGTVTAVSAVSAAAPGDTPPAATDEACNQPLCYTASSLSAERTRMVMQNVNIVDTTRGITRIKADLAEANGEDLGNSAWVLTGHVQVFMPQGSLSADRATVQFVNKRIDSMSAQGTPAEFEHSGAPAENAHGHAREIDYDLEQDLLKLNGDSWLSDGCNEIASQSIVYDIANQKVRADAVPGSDKQVQGTLHSRSGPQCTPPASRP
jgi:lipopolysaccharide transport protein LptA